MRDHPRVFRPATALAAGSALIGAVSCGTVGGSGEDGTSGSDPVDIRDLHHVALGDSYSSMGSRDADLLGPPYCLRSADNYPSLLDADVDDTCQGAVTDDLLHPRPTPDGELPAQIDTLTPETDVVTLTIGGNDIGFGPITDCIIRSMNDQVESACREALGEAVENRMDELPGKLDEVHRQIAARAGGGDDVGEGEPGDQAAVVATGYLPLIVEGDDRETCVDLEHVSDDDLQWATGLVDRLNDLVREGAERNGARYVLPDDAENHTACAAPEDRWVDFLGTQTDAYPMHPTASGQRAVADAVETAVGNPN